MQSKEKGTLEILDTEDRASLFHLPTSYLTSYLPTAHRRLPTLNSIPPKLDLGDINQSFKVYAIYCIVHLPCNGVWVK